MEGLLELPLVLAEARAVCGCAFVKVRERAFDVREGEWFERDSTVIVPCGREEAHREIARTLRPGTVEQMAETMTRRVRVS